LDPKKAKSGKVTAIGKHSSLQQHRKNYDHKSFKVLALVDLLGEVDVGDMF
jgi:hypothetical protein